jgi:hypothetical protein
MSSGIHNNEPQVIFSAVLSIRFMLSIHSLVCTVDKVYDDISST